MTYYESKLNRLIEFCFIQVTNRYIKQLKEGFPNHQWTIDYIARENAFERTASEVEA